MARVHKHSSNCIKTVFNSVNVYTFAMKIRDILKIQYVAVRGRSEEEGAVQRVLNKRRVLQVRDFVLNGNSFFNTFILNWTCEDVKPEIKNIDNADVISFPVLDKAAQVIDGQHRLSGIEEAIKHDNDISDQEVLVSLCINLSTSEAANIFLNINSEQKPVPKSLIYDLFGEVYDSENLPINRANDIAQELNANEGSPYFQMIQFPGSARGAGFIPLSTVVSALKTHLDTNGLFNRAKLITLDNQKNVLMNFFGAIHDAYKAQGCWLNKTKNPFLKSSGFNGAIDFLASGLLLKCAERRSFTKNTFSEMLRLDGNLIFDEDIKKMDGKSARKAIKEHLESCSLSTIDDEGEYDI